MIPKPLPAILILGSLLFASDTLAHSGGLDAKGCHAGSKPYHCHKTTTGEKLSAPTSQPVEGPKSAQSPSKPQTGNLIEGSASVSDGDTIRINGTKIRIAGIDAPESKQQCGSSGGGSWACGSKSTIAMQNLVARGNISCNVINTDRYGRAVATCHAGEVDIADELVRMGLALDYPQYKPSYKGAEIFARKNKLGMHLQGGSFVEPWRWRRGER